MIDGISYFMGKDGFNWFVGVVEDRDDPEHAGRVRVRCIGYHTDETDKIPTADLPWASVMMPVTAGGMSGIGLSPHFLVEGTWVVGFFRDPAKQELIILGALPGKNSYVTGFRAKKTKTIASSGQAGGQSIKGGFKDPGSTKPAGGQDVKYPTELYMTKPDTNLLAQESVDTHPSYGIKTTLEKGWTTATATADQPESSQKDAKYPYNHVLETESGHYIEFDDTKDNERIHVYHKTGTFIEIDPVGNVVIKTVGNVTNVIAGNMDTYVAKDYNLSVGGTMGVYSKGLVTEKFDAGRKTTITGTETLAISGATTNTYSDALTETVKLAVKQDYSMTLDMNIETLSNIKAKGAMTIGGSTVSFN